MVWLIYLGNIKQESGKMEKNDLKMNQNSSSLMLAGAQKWKKAQMSEKDVDKIIPKTQQVFEQQPSDS